MINNRYNIIHKLGEGRSQVFLCCDTKNSNRKVALKIISGNRSQEEINQFSNEFFILNNFNHPGIIKTYETQTLLECDDDELKKYNLETGTPFFTLEYFEGKPFAGNEVRLDSKKLKSIIKQICSVLFYIHQSNYIYADLKPDNILIDWGKSDPQIKFIDFGFATNIIDLNNFEPCGSAEYIAPEILMRGKVDHRADLYSFGIILYQIIYGVLPFDSGNEIEIYNSHVDEEFSFPENEEYSELVEVTKKLLNKDSQKRYNTSLEVMRDLEINYGDIYRDWLPAKVYIKRSGIHKYLSSYLTEDSDGRILILRGAGNSGKTALLSQISRRQENILPVLNFKLSDNLEFVKELLEVILNNEYVYNNIDENLRNYLKIQLKDNTSEIINRLPVIFSKIASQVSFTILLDDFNLYSQLILEVLINLIPRLQINNVRIIIGENSSFESAAKLLSNKLEIKVTPFNESEVDRFLKFSFNDFYPREDLKKVIMQGSDLFPGNILQYYRDLILLGIVSFEEAVPRINVKETVLTKIRESQNKIYEIRIDKLSPMELKLAEYISLFNKPPQLEILSKILEIDREELFYSLGKLRGENVLRESEDDVISDFTSIGIKEFIYSNCRYTEIYHLQAAEVMRANHPDLYSDELARHFELGGKYCQSYEIVKKQIAEAEQLSAINTKKNLLEHLLSYPLERKDLLQIKYSLTAVLSEINDFKGSMVLIEELLKEEDIENEQKDELKILRGKSHIFLGELEVGKGDS